MQDHYLLTSASGPPGPGDHEARVAAKGNKKTPLLIPNL